MIFGYSSCTTEIGCDIFEVNMVQPKSQLTLLFYFQSAQISERKDLCHLPEGTAVSCASRRGFSFSFRVSGDDFDQRFGMA